MGSRISGSWRRRCNQAHTGILDLLIHPHYAGATGAALEALEKDCGLERLWVYAGDAEQEKRRLLERAGYRRVAWLERQVKIEADYYGLTLYEKAVNRES